MKRPRSASASGALGERVGEDAEALEQVAAHVAALVAGDAAVGLEELEAAPLVGRERAPRRRRGSGRSRAPGVTSDRWKLGERVEHVLAPRRAAVGGLGSRAHIPGRREAAAGASPSRRP